MPIAMRLSMDVSSLMDSRLALAAGGALAMGITGSLHCFVMCGPLACAAVPSASGSNPTHARLAYQGGRLAAYTVMGAGLGGLGAGVLGALSVSAQPWLPWVMAGALTASALGLGKRLPAIPGLVRLGAKLTRASAKFSPPVRAGAIGAVTPLLPCGLLYGIYGGAIATQSVTGGALVMGAFALGGLPALLGAQLGSSLWWRSALATTILTRAVPLVAAAMLVFRAVQIGAGGDGSEPPSCH